jgi:hypothetical protein
LEEILAEDARKRGLLVEHVEEEVILDENSSLDEVSKMFGGMKSNAKADEEMLRMMDADD